MKGLTFDFFQNGKIFAEYAQIMLVPGYQTGTTLMTRMLDFWLNHFTGTNGFSANIYVVGGSLRVWNQHKYKKYTYKYLGKP